MPANTPDQGLVLPVDGDAADNPVAFTSYTGGVEGRLLRRYLSFADRTARDTAPVENQVTALAAEDRIDVFDGTNYISLHTRSLHSGLRLVADQTVNNSIALVNVTGFVAPLLNGGIYQWRCDLFYDSSTTEDIQFAFTWPGGSSARWGGLGMLDIAAAGTAGSVKNNTQTASAGVITYGGAGAGTTLTGSLYGEITAGANGNLQMQFSQAAAAATNTVIRARSRMHVWRVV